MISAINSGARGMEKAADVVDTAASNISTAVIAPKENTPSSAGNTDISRNAANLVIGHKTYDASAKIIEVAARMLDEIV